MFLVIFEDGAIRKAEEVSQDDVRSADDGLLDLIDISRPDDPRRYVEGGWHPLDLLG